MPTAPQNPAQRIDQMKVVNMLRLEDAGSLTGSMGQFLAGVGVCVGAGIVFASLVTFVLYAAFDRSFIGWAGFFLLYVFGLVPLLIWYERESRPSYFTDAAETASGAPSSAGEDRLNDSILVKGAAAAVMTWGPRALVDGFRGVRGNRTAGKHKAFARAATLVLDLARAHGGVPIKELVHPPEDMELFGQAVDLLDGHGWIGRATDGKSIWLNSTFRQKLNAAAQPM